MCTIEINNQYSRLLNPSIKVSIAVDTALSVEIPGCEYNPRYRSGVWDGKTHFFSTTTCKFPTGLLTPVCQAIKKVGEEITFQDLREEVDFTLPGEIKLFDGSGTITLRDYQYDAVKSALEATRGVINIATNGGKTECACGIMQCIIPKLKHDKRIAFFTSSKEIFLQTRERLRKRLNMNIGAIGDGIWEEETVTVVMIPTLHKYITKPKELPKNKKLTDLRKAIEKGVPNAKSDLSVYEEESWTRIKEMVKKTKAFVNSISCFIADEVHHASSDTWYDLLVKINAYYRFGLTGTIDEKDRIGLYRLYGCTGRIVCRVSNEFLIGKGYSAKPVVQMLPMECKIKNIDDMSYGDVRRYGIILNDYRNRMFCNKVIQRYREGKQCLLIVNETEHGEILLKLLQELGVTSVNLTHGEQTSKKRIEILNSLKDGSLRVLIATSILDEGVDISGINCLFLVAGGKSMRQLLQRIGRGLRKKDDGSGLEVYDSLDLFESRYLAEHTMERYTVYKSEGFEVQKL